MARKYTHLIVCRICGLEAKFPPLPRRGVRFTQSNAYTSPLSMAGLCPRLRPVLYNASMEFGISTQIHRRQPVTVDLLESIRKAGYERFELFCNRPDLDFHDPGLLRTVGRWF